MPRQNPLQNPDDVAGLHRDDRFRSRPIPKPISHQVRSNGQRLLPRADRVRDSNAETDRAIVLRHPVQLSCGHNTGLPFAVCVLAAPLMPLSRFDHLPILERNAVRLLRVIERTLCHHMTGIPMFVKNRIAGLDLPHRRKAIRRWDRRVERKFFAHLLRDLNVRRVELPIPILLDHPEQVANDLLLPADQLERLARPCPFGVAQRFNKRHRIVRRRFVIVRRFRHKRRGLVFLRRYERSPPHKKKQPYQTAAFFCFVADFQMLLSYAASRSAVSNPKSLYPAKHVCM